MPLWFCEYETCEKPGVQRAGDCLLCDRHLCLTHLQEPWHKCPKAEENWKSYSAQYEATESHHMDELNRRIDGPKLCSRASMLRGDIPCTIDLTRKNLSSMMGNQNCHAEIIFEDNVIWLARFRLATRTLSPPREVRNYIVRSEVATMNYIRQHTRIPVPKVFDWALESDPENLIGVSYIVMEKLDGKPLDWQRATPAQKEKVMQQLVDMFLEIEQHPFKAIGSLVSSATGNTEFDIQGLAHQAMFREPSVGPLGPFSSFLEGSHVMLNSYLTMIASGEVNAYCLADMYLAHRFRLDLIGDLCKDVPSGDKFFLKHPDDKGDHILVNDSFEIVGVIDWEWTRTVSRAEAFCSPCMMWPVDDFYNGSNELAADELRLADIFRERGREDLAGYVIKGRKIQRFFFGLGADSSFHDRKTFIDLFMGLKRAFDSGEEGWEPWKSEALEKWKTDKFLRGLLELEQNKF